MSNNGASPSQNERADEELRCLREELEALAHVQAPTMRHLGYSWTVDTTGERDYPVTSTAETTEDLFSRHLKGKDWLVFPEAVIPVAKVAGIRPGWHQDDDGSDEDDDDDEGGAFDPVLDGDRKSRKGWE